MTRRIMAGVPPALHTGLWMAFSAAGFGVLVGMVRHLALDLDIFVISFWRNAFAALLFAPWILRVGRNGLHTRRVGLYLLRSAIMVVSSVSLFFGVVLMPLAEATALSFTSPLFTTILAVLVLGETVGARRWAALMIGFGGVLIVLRPGAEAFDPAALVVLMSAASFAAVVITGKQLAATESPALITFYLSLLSIPLSLLPAAFVWQWPSAEQFLWLGAIGLMAAANMYGIAQALRIGDASMAMPFDFLRLPCTAAVGYVAFGQTPDLWTWIGAAVIFGSAVIVGHREAVMRRRAAAAT